MLLKDFPVGFTLGYSVHVLALMLQSILMQSAEVIDQRDETLSADEALAMQRLIEVLEAALRDAESLHQRVLN